MGTYVITEPCIDVKDGTCVEVCPVACIHTTVQSRQYYIDPDICIECEQCVLVCPVDAIYVDTEVPEVWKGYIETNAAFFQDNKPPVEPIPTSAAELMVEAARAYAAECGAQVWAVIVDASGEVIASVQAGVPDTAAYELAVDRARTAASTGTRSPGSHAVFDRLEIIGGLGVAGGTSDEDGLAARAGIARWDSSSR